MDTRLTLLGGFHVDVGPAAVRLPTRKAEALLAYLALAGGQAQPRDKLAALLWSESSDALARASLRQTLSLIGRALAGAGGVVVEGRTARLAPDAVDVDVVRFETSAAAATPETLERAVALYRGDLLQGLTISEPAFEEWLIGERERLLEIAVEAHARLLAHQRDRGDFDRAIQTALRLVTIDPLQEAAHRTLMRLYARQGRRGAALRQYQVCATVTHPIDDLREPARAAPARTACGRRQRARGAARGRPRAASRRARAALSAGPGLGQGRALPRALRAHGDAGLRARRGGGGPERRARPRRAAASGGA